MTDTQEGRTCPYCKETIRADAIRCRYCASHVPRETPEHGGTCPYCREEIHPEATRCRHCRADLRAEPESDCRCHEAVPYPTPPLTEPDFVAARLGGLFDGVFGGVDCAADYVRCRRELRGLGVPDDDAIRWCAFKHWGCNVRNRFARDVFV